MEPMAAGAAASGGDQNVRKWSKMKPKVAALAPQFPSSQSHPPSLLSAKAGCMVIYCKDSFLKRGVLFILTVD